MKGRPFLTRAVLASSVFCLYPLTSHAVLTNIAITPDNTTITPDTGGGAGGVGGYAFTINNADFTVNNGYIVGATGGVSFGNAANKAGDVIEFAGNATVQGAVSPVNPIVSVNINGGPGTVVLFQNDVDTTDVNVSAGGAAQFNLSVITANIVNTGAANTGSLIFSGANNTVNGNIGAANPFNLITVQNAAASTLHLDSAIVNAATINLQDGGVGNAATLSLENPALVLTGNITALTPNLDILAVTKSATINGNIGTAASPLAKVTLGGDLTMGNNSNIFAPVDGAHTLTFLGNSSITSPIGATTPLVAVVVNGPAGTTVALNTNITAADVNVNNGGTLLVSPGAHNISNNLSVSNASTLSISPATTLNVGALFKMAAGTTLQLDMGGNLANTGDVVATGAATFTAPTNVNIVNAGFAPTTTTIPIVLGGGGSAYNAPTVTSNSLLTHFTLVQNGNNLDLIATSQSVAANTNQNNTVGVASSLDAIARSGNPVGGLLGNIIGDLGLFSSQAQLTEALAELAPNVSGATMYESFMLQKATSDVVGDRLDSMNLNHHASNSYSSGYVAGDSNNPCYGSWVRLFGQTADQDSRDNIDGYKDDMWGLAGGFDMMVTEDSLVGIALSWATADVRYKIPGGGDSDIDSYQTAVYGQYHFSNPLYVNWFGAVAYNDYHNERNVNFANLFFMPTSDTHAWQYGAKAEVGYVLDDLFGNQALKTIPLVSLYYSHLDVESYTEQGANTANQTVDDESFDMLQAGLGIKFAYDCPYGETLLQPELHLNAFYDFIGDRFETTSQFVGSGPSFTTAGFKPAKDSYNIGASVSIFGDNNVTLTASYDFDIKDDYTANAGFLRLRYGW